MLGWLGIVDGQVSTFITNVCFVRCEWVEGNAAVVSVHDDGGVHLWDVTDGTHKSSLVGHSDAALCLACAEGTKVASGSAKIVRVWDINEPDAPVSILKGHYGKVQALAWSHQFLASGDADGCIKLWDPRQGSCTQTLKASDGQVEVHALSWSSTQQKLAIASDHSYVSVFDIRCPEGPLAQHHCHEASLTSVAFSPHSEDVLASASQDTTVRVSLPNGAETQQFSGHKDTITAIAWHPVESGRLVSVGWDSEAHVHSIDMS